MSFSPVNPSKPSRTEQTEGLTSTGRSLSLPHIFKTRSYRSLRQDSKIDKGDEQSPSRRQKHIPIIITDYTSAPPDKDFFWIGESTNPSLRAKASSRSFLASELSAPPRTRSPASDKRARHVEIVIPEFAQPFAKETEPASTDRESEIDFKDPFIDAFPTPPANMSRASTLDSTISAPSPTQLSSRHGSGAQLSSMNSSQTSLVGKNGYESASEHESGYGGQRTTPQALHSASPSLSNLHGAGHSSSGSSNLSGLVCNVHRTTGKEPHALVGASTTILGDKLYVFGGRRISKSRPSLTSDLYELDLLRRHWTKIETKGDMPPPRYFHSMCSLGDNKLVCYGGMSPENPPTSSGQSGDSQTQDPQVSVMSDVHIYDVPTRSWMRVAASDSPQGRYAHCAAILPSSATFASANAPMSAIQHNPAGSNPNQGTIGINLDGTGGAEMIVVGGQDSANHYIEQVSVFNLRSLKWTSTNPMSGRSCGAYRSVVTPLTTMDADEIGAARNGETKQSSQEGDDDADANLSGSPMLIYSNYNFLDVKLELQVRLPDGSLIEKPMQGSVSPPGLRFPSGGIIDNNFVVSGTFLTSSKQEFALWALDLRTLTWARIDTGSSVFSQGSWNRGVLWNRRNAFVILGNRKRSLVEDYNNRRLNFANMCLVQLEAFGLYNNPRRASPTSDYISMSAPPIQRFKETDAPAGRHLSQAAEELGAFSLGLRELTDMEFLSMDGVRIPVNSRLIARRWGPTFNALLQEGASSLDGTDTATLRPTAASHPSRNSSITITPSVSTGYSQSTTVTANSSSSSKTFTSISSLSEPPDPRAQPPNARPRILYLPHTGPTLQALLHYLYTSSLPKAPSPLATPQIFCSLLQLARPYKIDGLLEAVIERLHESLDGRNAAAIFNAAAMGAGGGDGIVFAAANTHVLPPRTSSIAGLEGLMLNGFGQGRGVLRIDTDVANGRLTRNTVRPTEALEEEDEVPDSASTTGSLPSMSSRRGGREDREVWTGEWSAVIGLQKRGLRGLMEGRRIRERGRSDGGSGTQEPARVGLGLGIA